MTSTAATPEEYLQSLPDDRREAIEAIRKEITANLDPGFTEVMQYGMISYVVPHSLYPAGYHTDPRQALPYMALASQKNFIAVYHMGIYGDAALSTWYQQEYQHFTGKKPDMGKSCLRFNPKRPIPVKLLGALAGKLSAKAWIAHYERTLNNRKTK